MVLFGENPQVSEFVKGMDKGLELLGFDSEEEKSVVSEGKSVGGVSEGKSVGGVSEGKSVGGVSEGKSVGGVSEGKSVGGVSEGKSVGGVSEGKSVGGVSEGKMVDGLNEKKVDALTTGKKTPTTEACTPWLTLRNRMTPHKHMHGESGKA